MSIPKKPKLDSWYEDGEGRHFKIVAIDDRDNTIEIQYFDGDVAEVENDTWYLLDLESVADPGDGSGPFDGVEQDNHSKLMPSTLIEEWANRAEEVDFDI